MLTLFYTFPFTSVVQMLAAYLAMRARMLFRAQ